MLRTTITVVESGVAFVSLEFRKEDQAREVNLEAVNRAVEFKASSLEKGR